MEHKLSVYQALQHKFALTPLMRQSMNILNMSTKELNEYVDSLMEKNPFLSKQFDTKARRKDYGSGGPESGSLDKASERVSRPEDPRLSLISQLRMTGVEGKPLEIAEYLIYEIDDNGYLKIETDAVAQDLSVGPGDVEEAVRVLRSMEPAGIAARDVRECLQLQLRRAGRERSLEYTIITDFINELARGDVGTIGRALEADEGALREAIKNIKKLDPKPASTALARSAEPVIPDLVARITEDDVYIELNREWVPSLRLYNPYEDKLEVVKDPQAREFLKRNMNDAKGLIDSLKRREETMCKVADCILRRQKASLKDGLSKIDSLTMGELARELNMHPSTISRALSNNYIEIEDKVVPLRSLLSHAVKGATGRHASKAYVKYMIKEMISNEDKKRPLCDMAIKEKLEAEGLTITRRTVAKYRDSLRILPTHLRKQRG